MTAGRPAGRTARGVLALVLLLAVRPSGRLAAQVSFHVALGGRYSSTLVHDSIVSPLDLRPTIAPAVLVAARQVLNPRWSAEIALDIAPSGLRRHEGAGGSSFDAGSVTTAAFTVGLRRELPWGLSGRVGFGALRYLGASDGVFREGSGGLFPLGTLALAVAPLPRRRLELEARYDVHRFITPALRSDGFTGARPVHRLALLVRIGWGKMSPS